MFVNEAMSTNVKVCHGDTNLDAVSRLMWENDCGAIPVVNAKNKPIGIVTDRDIAMAAMLNHRPLWEIEAGSLLSKQRLCSCHQDTSLEDCMVEMEQNGVRRMPVVGEDGRLVGIISMGDIVAFAGSKSGKVRKNGKSVPVDNVISMLQHVSAHHQQVNAPVIPA